jgi:hypothetical protein
VTEWIVNSGITLQHTNRWMGVTNEWTKESDERLVMWKGRLCT